MSLGLYWEHHTPKRSSLYDHGNFMGSVNQAHGFWDARPREAAHVPHRFATREEAMQHLIVVLTLAGLI